MTKEEIAIGLRNALARGEPIEKAMQSYVNAGYPISEVQEAAKEVNQGVTGTIKPGLPSLPEEDLKQKEKKKFPWKVVILVVVLLILLGALAVTFIFGDQIMQALAG